MQTKLITTRAQREAVFRLYCQKFDGTVWMKGYRSFRKQFQWTGVCGDYYLFGPYCGMFVGIERDGYIHS
jgi:hypothetical protein